MLPVLHPGLGPRPVAAGLATGATRLTAAHAAAAQPDVATRVTDYYEDRYLELDRSGWLAVAERVADRFQSMATLTYEQLKDAADWCCRVLVFGSIATSRPLMYAAHMAYADRITIEPGKRGGKPCIRGLRITVYDVLDYLASGMTEQQIKDASATMMPPMMTEKITMIGAMMLGSPCRSRGRVVRSPIGVQTGLRHHQRKPRARPGARQYSLTGATERGRLQP